MCTEYWLTALSQLGQDKSMVRLTDHLNMTIIVDWDVILQTDQNHHHDVLD